MQISADFSCDFSLETSETALTDRLFEFDDVIEEAGEKRNPSIIANYVYELAKEYNRFYHEVPVLKENNKDKQSFRIQLSVKTADIIKIGLDLLGIDVPEKM